jgi:hypothetical protein
VKAYVNANLFSWKRANVRLCKRKWKRRYLLACKHPCLKVPVCASMRVCKPAAGASFCACMQDRGDVCVRANVREYNRSRVLAYVLDNFLLHASLLPKNRAYKLVFV